MNKIIAILVGLSLLTGMCFAATPLQFTGVRQAAMGNAFVALADDINALHANPAGLTQFSGVHFNTLSLQANLSTDFLDKQGILQSAMNNNNEQDQTEILGSLVPLKLGLELSGPLPLTYTGSAPNFLNFLGSNMGIGGFAKTRFRGELVRPTLPTIVADANLDLALILGFAKKWDKGLIPFNSSIGYSLKYVNRYSTPQFRQSATEILNGSAIGKGESVNVSGFGLDVGTLVEVNAPYIGDATVGFVLQNIVGSLSGETKDVSGNVSNSAYSETLPITAKIGFAVIKDLKVDWQFIAPLINGKTTFAADYDLFWPNASFFKRLHFGAEKKVLGDRLALRAGLNQGFLTAGFGVDLYVVNINYAYFCEEAGSEIGVNPYDYHIIQFGLLNF